jgi:putative alpha-1,2-mannosidase
LRIVVNNQSKENVYVKSVLINGKVLKGAILKHNDIMNGGTIIFEMSNTPNIIESKYYVQ